MFTRGPCFHMDLPSCFDASHTPAVEALLAATQVPEQSVQDSARRRLEECETVPGYCSLLLVSWNCGVLSGFWVGRECVGPLDALCRTL